MAWQEPLTKFERRMTLFTLTLIAESAIALWLLWSLLEVFQNGKIP